MEAFPSRLWGLGAGDRDPEDRGHGRGQLAGCEGSVRKEGGHLQVGRSKVGVPGGGEREGRMPPQWQTPCLMQPHSPGYPEWQPDSWLVEKVRAVPRERRGLTGGGRLHEVNMGGRGRVCHPGVGAAEPRTPRRGHQAPEVPKAGGRSKQGLVVPICTEEKFLVPYLPAASS